MKLLTLEGLPKMCTSVLNALHRNKSMVILPSPMIPLATSVQVTAGDDICMVLSNTITRLKILQRMNPANSLVVCGGCHWIESPPVGMRERAILHRLTQELSRAILDEFQIHIDEHIIVMLKTSVHECFENLLCKMEARDYTLHDLFQENAFLETLTHVPGSMSAFPYIIHYVDCTPCMQHNEHEVENTARCILKMIT